MTVEEKRQFDLANGKPVSSTIQFPQNNCYLNPSVVKRETTPFPMLQGLLAPPEPPAPKVISESDRLEAERKRRRTESELRRYHAMNSDDKYEYNRLRHQKAIERRENERILQEAANPDVTPEASAAAEEVIALRAKSVEEMTGEKRTEKKKSSYQKLSEAQRKEKNRRDWAQKKLKNQLITKRSSYQKLSEEQRKEKNKRHSAARKLKMELGKVESAYQKFSDAEKKEKNKRSWEQQKLKKELEKKKAECDLVVLSDFTPEASPEAAPEPTPEATLKDAPKVTPEVPPEVTLEALLASEEVIAPRAKSVKEKREKSTNKVKISAYQKMSYAQRTARNRRNYDARKLRKELERKKAESDSAVWSDKLFFF